MGKMIRGWMTSMALLTFAAMILGGCASFRNSMGFDEEPPPPPAPHYYDFPDVLIPPELSMKSDESVIYESGGTKAGLLFFTGRVEVESLTDFFRQYLPKDGWTFVSSVKFSRILLSFAKPEKTCQIIIHDKTLTTEVEVWVHPYRLAEQ